jgi:nitrogen fixation NifU-like protein
MGDSSLYKQALLDHYRNPRNRENPSGAAVVRRGRNPRCGDDLEVGVDFDGDTLSQIRFRGRGCSICIASASMMTEAVVGKTRPEVKQLSADLYRCLGSEENGSMPEPPSVLAPLSTLKQYPARRRCVLLAWEALSDAINAD